MVGARSRAVSVLTAAMLVTSESPAQDYSAGCETVRITDEVLERPIHLDVWYPSADGPEQTHDYGLGTGRVVMGGAPAGDDLPVVVLSHGAMGSASAYSWIAEPLARGGFVVLGVSHFGESRVYGPETVDPASVTRVHDRTRDLSVALEFLIERSSYASRLNGERIGAIGHSSGGASVLMLAGVEFSADLLVAHCSSSAAVNDKGCGYARGAVAQEPVEIPTAFVPTLNALVVMDPAIGPGFAEGDLQALTLPTLVVGSVENDFLPYAFHAGRVSEWVPTAEVVRLDDGEGHFVYLNSCNLAIDGMGVPLCSDRKQVDRAAVHRRLAVTIEQFLSRNL